MSLGRGSGQVVYEGRLLLIKAAGEKPPAPFYLRPHSYQLPHLPFVDAIQQIDQVRPIVPMVRPFDIPCLILASDSEGRQLAVEGRTSKVKSAGWTICLGNPYPTNSICSCLPSCHPTIANEEQLVTSVMLHGSGWAVSVPPRRPLRCRRDNEELLWFALTAALKRATGCSLQVGAWKHSKVLREDPT